MTLIKFCFFVGTYKSPTLTRDTITHHTLTLTLTQYNSCLLIQSPSYTLFNRHSATAPPHNNSHPLRNFLSQSQQQQSLTSFFSSHNSQLNSDSIIKFYGIILTPLNRHTIINPVTKKGSCLRPRICVVVEYCARGSLYEIMRNEFIDITWSRFFQVSIIFFFSFFLASFSFPFLH